MQSVLHAHPMQVSAFLQVSVFAETLKITKSKAEPDTEAEILKSQMHGKKVCIPACPFVATPCAVSAFVRDCVQKGNSDSVVSDMM